MCTAVQSNSNDAESVKCASRDMSMKRSEVIKAASGWDDPQDMDMMMQCENDGQRNTTISWQSTHSRRCRTQKGIAERSALGYEIRGKTLLLQ